MWSHVTLRRSSKTWMEEGEERSDVGGCMMKGMKIS